MNKTALIRLLRLTVVIPVPVYMVVDAVGPHTLAMALALLIYGGMELGTRANDITLSTLLGRYATFLSVPAFVMLAVAHHTQAMLVGSFAEATIIMLLVPFALHVFAILAESIAEEFLYDSRSEAA